MKFTEQDILDIREKAALGIECKRLARNYDATRATISRIVHGHTHEHVGGLIRGRDYKGRRAIK